MSTPRVAERSSDGGSTGSTHHPEIDWEAAAQSTEFRELTHKRRSWVGPALAFVFIWYFGFIALAGYAPDFMGESIYEGFTVGYLLALTQFVMTWVLGWLYLRQSDRVFDPLARRAAETARAARTDTGAEGPPRQRRFEPDTAATTRTDRPGSEEVRH
jgi:uncharacterized membrane protein (DUF485 family)